MAAESDPSIGRLLDDVAQPFLQDQARLETQLAEAEAARTKLEKRITQIQRDQRVVRAAMIEALRQASRKHPVLSAAFFEEVAEDPNASSDPPVAIAPVSAGAGRRSQSNPLLNPGA